MENCWPIGEMEHRAIRSNMERMDRMSRVLEEPLSENDSIAGHLRGDVRSADEPLYGIAVASTGKETLQAESAVSAKGRETQAGPTNLKHPTSSQEIRNSINHNGTTLSVSASATPATTETPQGSIEDFLEADLEAYYQVDRALGMIHKNAPHARAKRATPGIPGYELFFDLTKDLEEQFKAASKGLVAQGIPIESPAGFDLWNRLDRVPYGRTAKKDVEAHEQAITTGRLKKKAVHWADAQAGDMHTVRAGNMHTSGAQASSTPASAATLKPTTTETIPTTTDNSTTKASPFYEMIHAASNAYVPLESTEAATSDADGEWEEDTEMLSAAQSHVQQ